MALLPAAPGQVPEQHRRAGPSAHQTPGPAGSGLRQSANRTANVGWLRRDGDDQKGTGSEHWRGRHAGSGRLCRGPVRDRGLIWALPRRFLCRRYGCCWCGTISPATRRPTWCCGCARMALCPSTRPWAAAGSTCGVDRARSRSAARSTGSIRTAPRRSGAGLSRRRNAGVRAADPVCVERQTPAAAAPIRS